jgi:hypothetical protein
MGGVDRPDISAGGWVEMAKSQAKNEGTECRE